MLKVMTFNLRTDSEVDGINRFANRSGRVLEAIRNENPDLIGFQEAAGHMRQFLYENLPEYTVIGCGSNAKLQREGNSIAFKKDKFELVGFETEFAKAVCEILGVNAKFQEISWAAKETELASKNIDCIWNGMTITDERLENMSISIPYMENKQVKVVKAK